MSKLFKDFLVEMEADNKKYAALSIWGRLRTKRFWARVWSSYVVTTWFWIRAHTIHRYHILDLRGEDNYDWGWIDADNKMLIACFKLLRDFVEKEDPKVGLATINDYGPFSLEGEQRQVEVQIEQEKEVRALYTWWTKERKEEQKLHNTPEEYNWSFERDQEMLTRLVAVRGCLWT